jgi:hypothetical protein
MPRKIYAPPEHSGTNPFLTDMKNPIRHEGPIPKDFTPMNRHERRALEAARRKDKARNEEEK